MNEKSAPLYKNDISENAKCFAAVMIADIHAFKCDINVCLKIEILQWLFALLVIRVKN